jgi:hypothetical protein
LSADCASQTACQGYVAEKMSDFGGSLGELPTWTALQRGRFRTAQSVGGHDSKDGQHEDSYK